MCGVRNSLGILRLLTHGACLLAWLVWLSSRYFHNDIESRRTPSEDSICMNGQRGEEESEKSGISSGESNKNEFWRHTKNSDTHSKVVAAIWTRRENLTWESPIALVFPIFTWDFYADIQLIARQLLQRKRNLKRNSSKCVSRWEHKSKIISIDQITHSVIFTWYSVWSRYCELQPA